jgi:hypothetical protein
MDLWRTIARKKLLPSLKICKKKDVFGNFNDLCMGKLWVELDELLWAGNHEQAGEFKNMITQDTQTCEGKYKKTREFDSYKDCTVYLHNLLFNNCLANVSGPLYHVCPTAVGS